MTGDTRRIAVMASGRGSNLDALHRYLAALGPRAAATIGLVVCDREAAGALALAYALGIDARVAAPGPDQGERLASLLAEFEVDLVVLAGYVRLVPDDVVRAYRGRLVNVHPALLPAFGGRGMYGGRVHQAVLDAGARVSGVTTHFVDAVYDRGAIIAQWPVPVAHGDTAASLGARVLRVEHLLYPRVVQAVAAGRVSLDDAGRAVWADAAPRRGLTFVPESLEDHEIVRYIDDALDCSPR
ncbi:MAG TPA: phosphoribosylglycinamide formyltransferase [Gemmatimonadaceae bacterium]|nr:phosphoribosylglycinamide formyltransferase [Gemmatimonadaceae bacterium]